MAIVPLIRGGDALVIDFLAGTNGIGALFSVNPTTGARTLLSDFGNPQQGPTGADPVDVAVGTAGDILVVDEDRGGGLTPGALFRVNPVNGSRTLLSDFTNATQGPTGAAPEAVALLSPTEALVLDMDAQPPGGGVSRGLLFRVNLATGARTVVSNFSDIAQGALGSDPADVEAQSDGSLVVIDATASLNNRGLLSRVDPVTGARTVISDFADAAKGPLGGHPFGVAVEPSGTILVIDNLAGTNGVGTLFRVDPGTGMRTVVSDFGLPGQGPLGAQPIGVTMFPETVLLSFCGDGVVDPGEQCDDGNAADGDGCSATCRIEGAGGVNRYLCYGTRPEKNSLSVFEAARGVTLADRVETLVVDVKRTESLCNPADVGGSGIVDPAAHLRTYTITQVPRSPRFGKRVGIGVVTELGALTVDLIKRDDLMVPSMKSLTGPVGPPGPNAGDRYKCYGVKVTAALPDQDVVVADQFNQPKTYDVGRATRLCLPVSKNGDDLENPLVALMCFGAKPVRGQPRHVPVVGINTQDEFWAERIRSVKETELCVPAETTGLP